MFETLPQLAGIVLQDGTQAAQPAIPTDSAEELRRGLIAIGVGLAVGLAGLGSGIAERGIGAAAVGSIAEGSMGLGIGIVLTVIPETLVLLALVVAFIV